MGSINMNDVQWRVDAMRQQIRSSGPIIPFLMARPSIETAPGTCPSCGDPVAGGIDRCGLCGEAARIVVGSREAA